MRKIHKQIISIALSVTTLFSLCSLNSLGAVLEMQSTEELIDLGTESCVAAESLRKFNEHIEQLRIEDPEQAKLIPADEELVRYMTREAYWESVDGAALANAQCSVSLPLAEYPDGSYFSYNGKACTCHANCTYSIPSGYSTSRCYNTTTSSSGNCKRYNGGIQCAGFAYYVFKQYNGVDCGSSNEKSGLSVLNDASLKFYFTSVVKVGGHARGNLNSGYPHSIIVTNITNDGISFYQANTNGNCNVSVATKTWTQLANWYDEFTISWSV